jgi:hypothetical protein
MIARNRRARLRQTPCWIAWTKPTKS